mmetsp:Transcript_11292/g.31702  ORF Transcript_11292/g.31702 Transcript_11292/m.31702 type:complete len:240 (-) Transcript_11292:1-720(-)
MHHKADNCSCTEVSAVVGGSAARSLHHHQHTRGSAERKRYPAHPAGNSSAPPAPPPPAAAPAPRAGWAPPPWAVPAAVATPAMEEHPPPLMVVQAWGKEVDLQGQESPGHTSDRSSCTREAAAAQHSDPRRRKLPGRSDGSSAGCGMPSPLSPAQPKKEDTEVGERTGPCPTAPKIGRRQPQPEEEAAEWPARLSDRSRSAAACLRGPRASVSEGATSALPTGCALVDRATWAQIEPTS